MDGRALLADVVGERLLRADAGAGRDLLDAVPGQRRSRKDSARDGDTGERDTQIVGLSKNTVMDIVRRDAAGHCV
jgi:hypothetical protein